MQSLSDFITRSDLFLTLTNKEGEKFEAGTPHEMRELSSKTILKWKVNGKYNNIFPFTLAVLHGKRSILRAMEIKPVYPKTETIVELEYR